MYIFLRNSSQIWKIYKLYQCAGNFTEPMRINKETVLMYELSPVNCTLRNVKTQCFNICSPLMICIKQWNRFEVKYVKIFVHFWSFVKYIYYVLISDVTVTTFNFTERGIKETIPMTLKYAPDTVGGGDRNKCCIKMWKKI